MRFIIATLFLASAFAVSALPNIEDPVAGKAFNDILARKADATPAQLGKRACDAFSPCCDPSTGCRSRSTCYKNCGSIPGTGSLGCVAGCAAACPEDPQC